MALCEGYQSEEGTNDQNFRLKNLCPAISKLLLLFFSLCALVLSQTQAQSIAEASTGPETVRIAYFEYGSYMALDEKQEPTGYVVDYLNEIARYANWEYDYIVYPSFAEAFDSVCSGQTDMLPAIYYSEQRTDQLLFPSTPFCQASTVLCTREDNDKYAYEDFKLFETMQIGIFSETRATQSFESFCKRHDIHPGFISYDSLGELTQALEDGSIDAIASMYLGKDAGYKILARFAADPMYLALTKDKEDLLQQLNDALSAIDFRNPYFTVDLLEKYFGINTNLSPVFTRDEYAYIEQSAPLKVVYESSRSPLSFTDKQNNAYAGATASLFSSISQTTGLSFEYIAVDNYLEGLDLVEQGKADLIYGIDASISGHCIKRTDCYLNSPLAKVSKKGGVSEGVAAMPDGYWDKNSFIEITSQEYLYFQTPEKCLDAILDNSANVAYLDLNVATYLLSDSRYESLRINALTNDKNQLCIGVSPQSNPLLVNILDRCIQYNSADTMVQWVSESSLDYASWNLSDFFRQYPLEVAAIVFITASIILLTIGYLAWNRVRNNRKFNALIYTDPLTKGWNLNRFQGEAAEIIKKDPETHYAIVYFDISRFKTFNAVFGFAEGDQLLIDANKLISRLIIASENERFAHITADEFVLLIRWRGWDYFLHRFNEYSDQLNKLDTIKNNAYRVIVIGGVCLVDQKSIHDNIMTVSSLIDCARYARESIGNKISQSSVALYNEDMKKRDVSERTLIATAEKALHNGEFVPYYQAKVEIISKKIVGFEALVRWISPHDGFRSPSEFIPLFEQSGFILQLDFYIYEQVCQRLKNIIDRGHEPVPISCNFSRRHLRNNDLPEKLKSIADTYEVDPRYLELELTENLLLEDFDRAREVCQRLKVLGFPIAIDDFGSGYSSLGTLQSLPVDVIKLDQSFLLKEEFINHRDRVILKGIIHIASQLGIKVVIEGVETLQQTSILLNFQKNDPEIDQNIIAQGFLYSRPVDLAESEAQFRIGYLEPHEP